jgi:hypothetical protein
MTQETFAEMARRHREADMLVADSQNSVIFENWKLTKNENSKKS